MLFFFLAPVSLENHDFPIMQQCKKKKICKKNCFLPNQKIQGKGTANKQFFMDGLTGEYNSLGRETRDYR